MSDQDRVYEELEQEQPKLILLNGKTSTGKTTLSKSLQAKYKCAIIELDTIVYGLDAPEHVNRFVAAYIDRDNQVYISSFVNSVRKNIADALASHSFVIIEGALANNETIHEIIAPWAESFLFIYIHPRNIEIYKQRLQSRFVLSNKDDRNGLPHLFWEKFSPEQLEKYYVDRIMTDGISETIARYAEESIVESERRLAMFSASFNHILKIEI